jgi:hypothetical protein
VWTHIGEEVGEAVAPTLADGDTAGAVIFPEFGVMAGVSSNDVAPGCIFWGVIVRKGVSVFERVFASTFASGFFSEAAAGF